MKKMTLLFLLLITSLILSLAACGKTNNSTPTEPGIHNPGENEKPTENEKPGENEKPTENDRPTEDEDTPSRGEIKCNLSLLSFETKKDENDNSENIAVEIAKIEKRKVDFVVVVQNEDRHSFVEMKIHFSFPDETITLSEESVDYPCAVYNMEEQGMEVTKILFSLELEFEHDFTCNVSIEEITFKSRFTEKNDTVDLNETTAYTSLRFAYIGYDDYDLDTNYYTLNGLKYAIEDDKAIVKGRTEDFTYDSFEIPSTLTFSNYYGRKVVTVVEIDDNVFANCTNLVNLKIGNNVEKIGKNAFKGCTNLKNIEVPNSLESIGFMAFEGCTNLKYNVYDQACYLGNENSPYLVLMKATSTQISSCEIYEYAKFIVEGAFKDCTALTNILVPSSVISVGRGAFEGCIGLESIKVPFVGLTLYGEEYTDFGFIFGLGNKDVPTSLKEVTITGETNIPKNAFWECENLKTIVISDSITNIGECAFYGCKGLERITLPFVGATLNGKENTHFGYIFGATSAYLNKNNVPKSLKEVIVTGGTKIDELAFYECDNVTNITLPNTISIIGPNAFSYTSLKELVIPNSVKKIEPSVFSYCESLETITISEGVLSIGEMAFDGCVNLKNVTLPNSLTEIENAAFFNMPNLKYNIFNGGNYLGNEENPYLVFVSPTDIEELTTFEINPNTKFINSYAFSGCTLLESVEIPNSVVSIGEYAFANCSSLVSLSIPESVLNIGMSAFEGCDHLENVQIPNSLAEAGRFLFYGCNSFEYNVYDNAKYAGNEENPYLILIGANAKNISTCEIHPDTKFISAQAFQNCSNLTSIIVPDKVVFIGDYAFNGCSSLSSVVIGNSVTSVGYSSFSDCDNIESMTIPFVGTKLDGSEYTHFSALFDGGYVMTTTYPSKLKEVTITGGTTIDDDAFKGCYNVTSITLPNTLTSIGKNAFLGCKNLKSVIIPEKVTIIDLEAFAECSSLTSVKMPTALKTIGSNAFRSCTSLTDIVIPNTVTSIGIAPFFECDKLKYNEYDNGMYLGNEENPYLFFVKVKDNEVTSFEIHSNTRFIESANAFNDCQRLTSIVIPDKVTILGNYLFSACTGLTSIVVPASVTTIGSNTFDAYTYEKQCIYYAGSASDWQNINIGENNKNLTYKNIYYFSENKPELMGNYWHYDSEGNIVSWFEK